MFYLALPAPPPAPPSGPSFIQEVRTKQHGNPEYEFLNGGQGAAYFYWTLYNLVANTPPTPSAVATPSLDPLCVPPGLLPGLVADTLQTEPPYTPLRVKDVLDQDVPPMPVIDEYLSARLDKFYAQLADFRPGMSFSDLEPRKVAQETNHQSILGSSVSSGVRGGRGGGGVGGSGLGYGGGGSTNAEDSMYASFRQMRSQGYHSQVVRFAAGK